MGYEHARSYSRIEEVDLYVCDLDREKMEQTQAELAVKGVFESIDEVLESSKIDAVDTALPHSMHRDVAVKSAAAGKHFMTEKPLARNLAEADEMVEVAEKAGVKFMVAEGERFAPSIIKARELIDQGLLGKVFLVRVHQMDFFNIGGWRLNKEITGGGNLIDSGIHEVDALRSLGASDVELVFSQTTGFVHAKMEGEDTQVTIVRFKNGTVGNLISSWGIDAARPEACFAAYGVHGSVWREWSGQRGLYLKTSKLPEASEEPVKIDVPNANGFDTECRHFVECILKDKEPLTGPKEGRADLELAVAAYKSAETGTAVRMPLQENGFPPHCILASGDIRRQLEQFADLKGMAKVIP